VAYPVKQMPGRDPFANFERLRREMDELFGDVLDRTGLAARRGFVPRVDVFYCGDPPRAVVKAELAGVDPDEVSIELRGRQLLIAGERTPAAPRDPLYQRMEIERGPFRRVVELGADVEPDRAEASYDDGILRVEIPLANRDADVRQVRVGGRSQEEIGGGSEAETGARARGPGRDRERARRDGGEAGS
jgi:HSP20 family protein